MREAKAVALWFCFREHIGQPATADEIHNGKRYVFSDYCGAPAGVRCGCWRVNHDPGDEDHETQRKGSV